MLFKKRIETDEEFIARIRRRVKNFRKIAFVQFIFSLVLLAASLFFLFAIHSGTQPDSFKNKTTYIYFSFGVAIGALFAFAIEMAISNFVDAVSNFKGRKEYTLLLKYYDQLNPLKKNSKEPKL
jgi:ABC-type bacteriocin/lantibiotic exporter with double-glycine peptidase domain